MRQLVLEKENSEFKPVKLRLKIDRVSYPMRAEGLVNMYKVRIEGKVEQFREMSCEKFVYVENFS